MTVDSPTVVAAMRCAMEWREAGVNDERSVAVVLASEVDRLFGELKKGAREHGAILDERDMLLEQQRQANEFYAASIPDPEDTVSRSVYEQAVKGRQDFRAAFKDALADVRRLREEIANWQRKWEQTNESYTERAGELAAKIGELVGENHGLRATLKRYEEREPLVQALLDAASEAREFFGDDPSDIDPYAVRHALKDADYAVRDFKLEGT